MKKNDLIESLISKVQDSLLDEKNHTFPEFPLKPEWSAIVWNEWHTEISELDASDEGNDIISPENFKVLADSINEINGSLQCWLIEAEPFVDCDGKFIERNFTRMDLTWTLFNNFHKLFDFPPSRFYLLDDTLRWFVQVDESVLIAGDPTFMNVIVRNLGGYEMVLNGLNNYANEGSCSQTKEWLLNITNRFKQRHTPSNK